MKFTELCYKIYDEVYWPEVFWGTILLYVIGGLSFYVLQPKEETYYYAMNNCVYVDQNWVADSKVYCATDHLMTGTELADLVTKYNATLPANRLHSK